jgi:membrane protein implicated in regulation of membrane protease activity
VQVKGHHFLLEIADKVKSADKRTSNPILVVDQLATGMAPWTFKTVKFLCVAIILVWFITAAPRSTEARSTAALNERLARKLKVKGTSVTDSRKR